jgi:hypothetical protein
MNVFAISAFHGLCLASLVTITNVSASDDLTLGDAVIDAVDLHEDGYQNLQSNVTMILENAQGRRRERHLDVYTIEVTPLGDRRKFIFNRPADIKGTAVLVHSNVTENDYQWIYLPAFKRVKRIASANKSTPFVGSEYSYEDLSSQEKEKYSNRYIENTNLNGKACDVIERIPRFPLSAYSRLLAYVDVETHRYQKVEYFNTAGIHVKTQHLEQYQLFDHRYWLPTRTVMKNHVTNKTTIMLWDDIQLKTAQSDTQFTPAALKRSY